MTADEALKEARSDTENVKSITPKQTALIGTGVLGIGALFGGCVHWTGTSKALKEEGIDQAARLRALPLAFKALGISTFVSITAAIAFGTLWRALAGDSHQASATLSFATAIAFAQAQRDQIRSDFRKQFRGEDQQ